MDQSSFQKQGMTIWMTGLSGAGKTTLAQGLSQKLSKDYHFKCKILDGDIIRKGLNQDLGFSKEDRIQNLRRIAQVAKLFTEEGYFTIVAFISPLQESRNYARSIHIQAGLPFKLVYINTSLAVCEARDTKGLYSQAREGIIPEFTGISSPFQLPSHHDIEINTEHQSIQESVGRISQGLWPKTTIAVNKIKISRTSREWLKIFKEGWAGELTNFMDEEQLSECIHFRRVTINGKQVPLTIPILCIPEQELSTELPKELEVVYQGLTLAKLHHP